MFTYNDLTIRLVEENDLSFLMELRRESWETLGNISMINNFSQKKWFEKINNDISCNYYVVTINEVKYGERIGLIRTDEIDYINRSMRIGCDVKQSLRNKGYGTTMMNAIIDYAFNYLNMNRVWLFVLDTNIAAKELYKKIGFVEEGRQRKAIYRYGKYYDYIMMGLLKGE